MGSIIPEVAVSNMENSLKFYNTLGFTKTDDGIIDENGSQWSSLDMGGAALWLIREDVVPDLQMGVARGNGVNIYISADDVDAVYEKIKVSGYQMNIVKDIETAWYGLRHFSVADPDGYVLTLNMQVAQEENAQNNANP